MSVKAFLTGAVGDEQIGRQSGALVLDLTGDRKRRVLLFDVTSGRKLRALGCNTRSNVHKPRRPPTRRRSRDLGSLLLPLAALRVNVSQR